MMVYSVYDKVKLIGDLIRKGSISPNLPEVLGRALNLVPEGDVNGELNAVYVASLRAVRYTDDPEGYDIIRSFDRLLNVNIGDCASIAVFVGSLLQAAGFQVRVKLVHPVQGSQWHVYALAGVPKYGPSYWIPVDPVLRRGVGAEIEHDWEGMAVYDVETQQFVT